MEMKKSVLVFSMITLLIVGGFNMATAQEQPKPKKDTVNMDTDAKPQFYYPVEDEKGKAKGSSGKGSAAVIGIIGGVVVVGAAGFFIFKKKK
jgi:hypothetical protein